jgi:uncharacterized protein
MGSRENRIAVRFQSEWHDGTGQRWRSYCNELWEFAPNRLMSRRESSINDRAISESERRIFLGQPARERKKVSHPNPRLSGRGFE